MLEYQSLKWNNQQDACACESVTPVCFERNFSFFYPKSADETVVAFEILSANGDKIEEVENIDFQESDNYGFAFLQRTKRIAFGDYFRIATKVRYPLKTYEEQSFNLSTYDDILSMLNCGNGIPALQFDNSPSFTAENDCYVAISAYCELTDSEGKYHIFNENDARIYRNCNDITNKHFFLAKDKSVDFEIALPSVDTSKSYIYLDIRYYIRVYPIGFKTTNTSSLMQRVSIDEFSDVQFYCTNDEFGFPFSLSAGEGIYNIMPIKLSKPQYTQNDKIYTKSNGENVILFSEMVKEYEGTTDYVNEKTHEMILIALSCDEVYINGERLTKSDKYEIDWENYTTDESGEKLARATFKMKANVNRRNSNC